MSEAAEMIAAAVAGDGTPAPKPKAGGAKLPGLKIKTGVKAVQPTAPKPTQENPPHSHGVLGGEGVVGATGKFVFQKPDAENKWHLAGANQDAVSAGVDPGQKDSSAIITAQAQAITEVKHPDGTTDTVQQAVGKPKHFSAPPCEVEFGASYKKNMGNYESAEIRVGIKIPAAHAEINSVYDFAVNWVDTRMETAMAHLDSAAKKG